MSTPTRIDELFRNTGGLNGLFRELQRPNLANIAYVHALRSSQQQGTSIYDSAAYADSQDSAFWWKIRRDAEFASYIENRRKSVAGLKSLVVPGTKAPTKADILVARAQDYLWDLQPGARRTRYGLTEGIFRGSSWAAMTAVKRTLQLPGDDRPRVWYVPGKFQHVDRWRFRIQRRTDRGDTRNPTGNFWEFFSWKTDNWVPLEHPEHFLSFFYDRTESDHGYGYGLNNSLYVWLKGKEIALNNGLRGLRRWASGIMRVKIDELRNASADKDNLQHSLDWLEVIRTLYTEDVLVYGKNDDVDAIWPSGQGHQIVMSMIEYFDASAKRLIQSADPEGGAGQQGSFAKAAVQADEKADYFAFDRDNLSEDYSDQGLGLFYELNKPNYAALCKANKEPLGVPGRYQIGAREDMDPQAAAEYIGKLQEAGFEIPKQWAHDLANVPIAQEDEETLERPEPAAPEGGGDPFGGEFNGEAEAAGAGGSLGANGQKRPTEDNRLQFAAAIPDCIPDISLPGFDTGASYAEEIKRDKDGKFATTEGGGAEGEDEKKKAEPKAKKGLPAVPERVSEAEQEKQFAKWENATMDFEAKLAEDAEFLIGSLSASNDPAGDIARVKAELVSRLDKLQGLIRQTQKWDEVEVYAAHMQRLAAMYQKVATYAFDESKVKRDGGKFATKEGAGKAEDDEGAPDSGGIQIQSLAAAVAKLDQTLTNGIANAMQAAFSGVPGAVTRSIAGDMSRAIKGATRAIREEAGKIDFDALNERVTSQLTSAWEAALTKVAQAGAKISADAAKFVAGKIKAAVSAAIKEMRRELQSDTIKTTVKRPATRMQTYADGRWVTIGQGEGEGSGGTPVLIEGGEITKGPAAVENKQIADVDKDKPPPGSKKKGAPEPAAEPAAEPAGVSVRDKPEAEEATPSGEKIEHTAESAAQHVSAEDFAAVYNKRELKQVKDVIGAWGAGWSRIQSAMRGQKNIGDNPRAPKVTAQDKKDAAQIQKLLDKGPHVSGTVQRGLAFSNAEADQFVEALKSGTLDHDVPTSWSTESDQASGFSKGDDVSVIMTANTDRGVSIPALSSAFTKDEQEVMIGAGGMKVTNWSERTVNGKRVIEVSIDARG